jgi:hypothetical protein
MPTTLLVSALAAAAIVQADGVALRSAARDSATAQATLTQGDILEVRGHRLDYLQVYDYRRERAGFVKMTSVRNLNLEPSQAPHFLSVVRLLRDSGGQESLGMAYAQSYLKVSEGLGKDPHYTEVLDSLGAMAERLANRANTVGTGSGAAGKNKDNVAAQVESAGFLGVRMISVDHHGQQRLCYDGQAYRQIMAAPAASIPASYRVNAALALTKPSCIDSRASITARREQDQARLAVIEKTESGDLSTLSGLEANRLRHRKATVLASLSFFAQRALVSDPAQLGYTSKDVTRYAAAAITTLAGVDKAELTGADKADYEETALRVGAIRLAAVPLGTLPKGIWMSAGEPGQTCVNLGEQSKRCTFGVVWPQSLSVSPNGQIISIAVQPTETWRELWIMRKVDNGWVFDVLPPSLETNAEGPGLGLAEFAGWVPADNKQEARLLVARDVFEKGRVRTTFEVLKSTSLMVDGRANHPQTLFAFAKFQQAVWRGSTLTVR